MLSLFQHLIKKTLKQVQGDVILTLTRHSELVLESLILSMAKGGSTYIMSNKNRTVLYIGVTSDLISRILEHKSGNGSKFTKKYNCTDLLYYESFAFIEEAISREKQLKN